MAKSRLGRGLDSLIPVDAVKKEAEKKEEKVAQAPAKKEKPKNGYVEMTVKLTQIIPDKKQARTNFDEDKIQELAESIKQHGLVNPPTVIEIDNNLYQLVGGERRWRACQVAGVKEIPVRVVYGKSERELVEIGLIDNIQREDLNAVEEAKGYKRLIEEFNMKQDEVAERVSKSRVAITNSLRLLKLSDDVQQMLIEGLITSGHARAILGVEDKEKQTELAQQVVDEKLSVREIEKIVKNLGKVATVKPKPNTMDEGLKAVYDDIQEQLKARFSTKVTVAGKGDGSGKIEIEFYSNDDMERILDIISHKE